MNNYSLAFEHERDEGYGLIIRVNAGEGIGMYLLHLLSTSSLLTLMFMVKTFAEVRLKTTLFLKGPLMLVVNPVDQQKPNGIKSSMSN